MRGGDAGATAVSPGRRGTGRRDKIDGVLGPVIIVLVLVLVIPPAVLMGGAVVSALLGWLLTDYAEQTHPGSELIDLNT